MTVKIGHASQDENGKARGGTAGDQTKKEVCTRNWYNKPWTHVIRPLSAAVAEKIAKACEQACANDNVGYDQDQRKTLFPLAKAAGWDISKVTEKCECDCSELVRVCVNAAGIEITQNIYTGNQARVLRETGHFAVTTDKKYTGSDNKLRRGDILLGEGHTAIVLTNGSGVSASDAVTGSTSSSTNPAKVTATDSAKKMDKALAGLYKVSASALNIRHGAGITKKVMVAIPKGVAVRCYGYYSVSLGTKWLYVRFTYRGTTYTGFASSKYLVK